MKIHSRFKDYYDFVAHQYGGGDPKVVYNRERVVPAVYENGQFAYEGCFCISNGFAVDVPDIQHVPWRKHELTYMYLGLAVAGRYYVLVRVEKYSSLMFQPENLIKDWTVVNRSGARDGRPPGLYTWYVPGIKIPSLAALSCLIKAPVFTISRSARFSQVVDGKVPILGDLGFGAVMPPEQCYQEIALFLGNEIINAQDAKPEPITDIQKAENHGFDKKESFRHRK
jgi:hypothetical protein